MHMLTTLTLSLLSLGYVAAQGSGGDGWGPWGGGGGSSADGSGGDGGGGGGPWGGGGGGGSGGGGGGGGNDTVGSWGIDTADVPPCFLSCLTSIDWRGCATNDVECLCENEGFADSLGKCAERGCSSQDELDRAQESALDMCSAHGVSVSSQDLSVASSAPTSSSSAAGGGDINKAAEDDEDSSAEAHAWIGRGTAVVAAAGLSALVAL